MVLFYQNGIEVPFPDIELYFSFAHILLKHHVRQCFVTVSCVAQYAFKIWIVIFLFVFVYSISCLPRAYSHPLSREFFVPFLIYIPRLSRFQDLLAFVSLSVFLFLPVSKLSLFVERIFSKITYSYYLFQP